MCVCVCTRLRGREREGEREIEREGGCEGGKTEEECFAMYLIFIRNEKSLFLKYDSTTQL